MNESSHSEVPIGTNAPPPVLIIGGSGVVGSETARLLRRFHPELPIAIGGRDIAKATAVADEVGGATAVRVDVTRDDLGQKADAFYGAVAVFVKDESLNSLRYAQRSGAAYVSISSGITEVATEVAQYIHSPSSAAVLLGSQWLAGAATLPALLFAREYQSIDSIRITAVLDDLDMGGPAAAADYERITQTGARPLVIEEGKARWLPSDEARATFLDVDGVEMSAQAYSPLDITSLASTTQARSVRFDLAVGESAGRRKGEHFSTEMAIEISGTIVGDSTESSTRHVLTHAAGQAPVTALGVVLGIERLLGLDGKPPAPPGLHLPETLIDPGAAVGRWTEIGMVVARATSSVAS